MFEILMASAQTASAVFLIYGAYIVLGEIFSGRHTREDVVTLAPTIAGIALFVWQARGKQ